LLSHRIVWQLYNGEILNNLCVCHHCDNPACVNIDHLFLGTPSDNQRDSFNKKRGRIPNQKGEEHSGVKLTEKDVLEIRESSLTGRALAKIYNVCPNQISLIRLRKNWTHI
jgi:HNH endonuclease